MKTLDHRFQTTDQRRRIGFSRGLTLIEMLVVMAIILILAAITHKVVMRAMKKAEDVEQVNTTRDGNIGRLIDKIESGEGYDGLPPHLQEGRFGESE